jgi:hypothetical protein
MRDAAGKAVDGPVGLCGTLNPVTSEDFIRIPSGQAYAPFGEEPYAAFELYHPPVKKPGVYTIRFYYSSASSDISRYMGFEANPRARPAAEIERLFARVPRFEVLRELKLTFTARTAKASTTDESPAG